jgi:hypothetical protein
MICSEGAAATLSQFGSPLLLGRVHWVQPEMVVEVSFAEWTHIWLNQACLLRMQCSAFLIWLVRGCRSRQAADQIGLDQQIGVRDRLDTGGRIQH